MRAGITINATRIITSGRRMKIAPIVIGLKKGTKNIAITQNCTAGNKKSIGNGATTTRVNGVKPKRAAAVMDSREAAAASTIAVTPAQKE